MNVETLRDRWYPAPEQRDPLIPFRRKLAEFVDSDSVVLDIGAGAGINGADLKGKAKRVVGVDLDDRVASNPNLDDFWIGDVANMPYPDNTFDIAYSVYVLEHIADPEAFVRELSRVLKPGGVFVSLTPNRYHYVAMLSSLTPLRFHRWVNRRRGRDNEDTFPTVYRLNSPRDLRRYFAPHGLDLVEMRTIEVQPTYLMFSLPTFLVGAAYERIVNSSPIFERLRVNLIPVFQLNGGLRKLDND